MNMENNKKRYITSIEPLRVQGGASFFTIYNKNSLPVKPIAKNILRKPQKEAPPCIRTDGSYMAEFAVTLPFFAAFMVVLLFFFQTLMVQQEVGNALLTTGRELSVLVCETDMGKEAGTLSAKALLLKHLKKDSAAEAFIRGGRWGILLVQSDFSGSFIFLQADYKLLLPIGLFGRQEITITQKVKCRKWTGRSSGEDSGEKIVFITPTGSVYHLKRSCTYLNPSVRSVLGKDAAQLRNSSGGKYYPCESCVKTQKTDTMTVYITTYGNRFHSRRDCSRIKRNVTAIRLSEAGGRKACAKCGKE